MSREIKFRAWDSHAEVLWPVELIDFKDDQIVLSGQIDGKAVRRIAIYSDCVLQQSTGLLDKNGVEIYEGDIVKWADYYGDHVESVEWAEYDYKPFYDPRDDGKVSTETEVVGNVHENPELLP